MPTDTTNFDAALTELEAKAKALADDNASLKGQLAAKDAEGQQLLDALAERIKSAAASLPSPSPSA